MIVISTENRLREIADNLKRDVKELLDESASIVTELFKNGFFTATGVSNCWKAFANGFSYVAKTLADPLLFAPVVLPEQQPLVTVVESTHADLPAGTTMTLSEAEQKVAELTRRCLHSDEPDATVKVAIDYRLGEKQDRYFLPLQIHAGKGGVLEQLQDYVEVAMTSPEIVTLDFYCAPSGLGNLLHEHFGSQIQNDMEKMANQVLSYFQQHNNISLREQQLEKKAAAMPLREQKHFRESTKKMIADLRYFTNTGKAPPGPQHEPPNQSAPSDLARQPTAVSPQQSRPSVRVQLRQIKEGQSSKPVLRKSRNAPQR